MGKIFKRIVSVSLICSNLLFTSCNNYTSEINNTLEQNLIEDTHLEIDNIPYFASWNLGLHNYVAILVKKNKTSKQDRFCDEKFIRIDYVISKEDYDNLQKETGSFEALYPFSFETYKLLNNIVLNYEPVKVTPAILKENGDLVLNEIS